MFPIRPAVATAFLGVAPFLLQAQTPLPLETASRLAALPMHCIVREFPNKTSHTSDGPEDHRLLPRELHPAFYGCFDWHSSVHGHWMLVKLLKMHPDLPEADRIAEILDRSFSKDNMLGEAAYFTRYKVSRIFERTYGWAWLLKLDEELATWKDPRAQKWHRNLQPLTETIVGLWTDFLPKQTYPNRTGVHPNTAFGLVFALDWARALGKRDFEKAVVAKSLYFYRDNKATPAYLEPDGADFLSPGLEIADLMSRVLPANEFTAWLEGFFEQRSLDRLLEKPVVSDRTDYQIVHLDGLYLSRAWCLKSVAAALPGHHPWRPLFRKGAADFLDAALPQVTSGHYGGDHWLASFAVYAIYH